MKNRNPFKINGSKEGPNIILYASVLLSATLLLLLAIVPLVINYLITRELQLVQGTEIWNKWENVDVPMFIRFYIFNVTNPDEVVVNGSRFHVEEIGPYTWQQKRKKLIVSQNDEEDSVTYKEVTHYYFRPDLSVGSQEDTVNIVNAPFVAVASLLHRHLFYVLANYAISLFESVGETMVSRGVKIRDLTFDGVQLHPVYGTLGDYAHVELPEEFIDGTFAFYNQKNGTPGSNLKINRGTKDHRDLGEILEYDDKPQVSWWTNHSLPEGDPQYCNAINGTDGSFFPPFVTKNRQIYVFNHEVCRSLYGFYDSDVEHKGIPAYRFLLPSKLLRLNSPENSCFCQDPGEGLDKECLDGTMRMFTCKRDIPVALSKPHFLDGDPSLLSHVSGLRQNRSAHDSEIIIEPNTGGVLKVVKRLQANVEIQHLPGITFFEKVPPGMVPVFWAEESGEIEESTVSEFRLRLVIPLQVIYALLWSMVAVLVLVILIGIKITVLSKPETKKQTMLQLYIP